MDGEEGKVEGRRNVVQSNPVYSITVMKMVKLKKKKKKKKRLLYRQWWEAAADQQQLRERRS